MNWKIIKTFFVRIAKSVLLWALNRVYNYVDKNQDGVLSKEELTEFFKKVSELKKKLS